MAEKSSKKKTSVAKKMLSSKTIDIYYKKTNNYRTYHVDGVFGGVTPRGKFYIELYIDRSPTPQTIRHKIDEDGKIGDEVNREGKEGIIREIEAGLIMDYDVARSIRDWLDAKIKILDAKISLAENKLTEKGQPKDNG
jgi:hypothetical protein